MPGVVEEIVDSEHGGAAANVAERVVMEAQKKLDHSEHLDGKKDQVLSQIEMGVGDSISETGGAVPSSRTARKRVKIVSTPIGGGDMFAGGSEVFQPVAPLRRRRRVKTMSTPISGAMWGDTTTVVLAPGEILVNVLGPNNEKFAAKMKQATYKKLSEAGTPFALTAEEEDTQFVGQYLDGFVRRKGRTRSVSNVSAGDVKLG